MEKLIPDVIDKISLEIYLDNINESELTKKLKELISFDTSIQISEDVKKYVSMLIKKELDDYLDSVKDIYTKGLDKDIKDAISMSIKYNNHVKEEPDGSYSIYPSNDKDDYPFLDELTNYLVNNNKKVIDSKDELLNIVNSYNSNTYNKLINGKINEYYGDIKFLSERVLTIRKGMESLLTDTQNEEDKQIIYNNYEKLIPLIISFDKKVEMLEKPIDDSINYKLSKEEYDEIINDYKQIISIEKDMSKYSEKLWKEFFENNDVRFSHFLNSGVVSSNNFDKICTTLSSEECIQPVSIGKVGYEYKMPSMDEIQCIAAEDADSWRIRKEEFLNYGILTRRQYSDDSILCYSLGFNSKLLTPSYVFNKSLEYSKTNESYTEIILDNRKRTIKPVAAFILDDATEEEITKIKEIAEEENLDIVYRTNVKRRNNNESKFL